MSSIEELDGDSPGQIQLTNINIANNNNHIEDVYISKPNKLSQSSNNADDGADSRIEHKVEDLPWHKTIYNQFGLLMKKNLILTVCPYINHHSAREARRERIRYGPKKKGARAQSSSSVHSW